MNSSGLVALLFVAAVLSVFTLGFVFSYSAPNAQETPQPTQTITPPPTTAPSSAPSATPNPKPAATPTPDPAAEGSFGAKGYFCITSPTRNGIFDGGNVTLVIGGEAANLPLFMSYSLDGQEKVSFGAVIKQAHEWDQFFGVISASELLPPLASGTHTLTVYGTLSEDQAQATVNFAVR